MDYKFPGVYPTITDLSQVVSANSVISCAYVGMAEFGPINKPTLITNVKGFNQKFGKLDPKYGYEGFSLAVAADTINQHYFVRVVGEDARFGAAKFAFEDEHESLVQVTEGYNEAAVKIVKKYGFKVLKIHSTGHHPERFFAKPISKEKIAS